MSLYNHVDNKDDVLDGVLDHVLHEVPLPDPTLAWDDQLSLLAHGSTPPAYPTRGVPDAPIPTDPLDRGASRGWSGPRHPARAGLDPDAALDAFLALSSFVLGRMLFDMGEVRQVGEARQSTPSTWSS